MLLTGCQAIKPYEKKLTGSVNVQQEQLTGEATKVPRMVYIKDFQLDNQDFQPNQGVTNRIPVVSRLENRRQGDPASQAATIVNNMSQALVDEFNSSNFPAQRIGSDDSSLTDSGWLVQGVFTEVDEGDRLKRAVIGFGQGSTQMTVQIGVSDLASANPKAAFIVFGTVKDPGKMPGAIVTMNPYVAAAKFVMEKNATKKDIENTARQIVAEILKYKTKFIEQSQRDKPSAN
jgi:hypothetical protein